MANPKRYNPGFSFSDYQSGSPAAPLPGPHIDGELHNIALSLAETIDALADIRRSDGSLNAGVVQVESLGSTIKAEFERVIAAGEKSAGEAAAQAQHAIAAAESVTDAAGATALSAADAAASAADAANSRATAQQLVDALREEAVMKPTVDEVIGLTTALSAKLDIVTYTTEKEASDATFQAFAAANNEAHDDLRQVKADTAWVAEEFGVRYTKGEADELLANKLGNTGPQIITDGYIDTRRTDGTPPSIRLWWGNVRYQGIVLRSDGGVGLQNLDTQDTSHAFMPNGNIWMKDIGWITDFVRDVRLAGGGDVSGGGFKGGNGGEVITGILVSSSAYRGSDAVRTKYLQKLVGGVWYTCGTY